jgi:hypothetical protein
MGYALDTKGRIWCWGRVSLRNTIIRAQLLPASNATPGCVKAISANGEYLLALAPDGKVFAWGYNAFGQCGVQEVILPDLMVPCGGSLINDNGIWRLNPTNQIENVRYIVAGVESALVIKSDGTVWVWGSNSNGQLGRGGTPDQQRHPVPGQADREDVIGNVTDLIRATVAGAGCRFELVQTFDGPVSTGRAGEYVLGNGTNAPDRNKFGDCTGDLLRVAKQFNDR